MDIDPPFNPSTISLTIRGLTGNIRTVVIKSTALISELIEAVAEAFLVQVDMFHLIYNMKELTCRPKKFYSDDGNLSWKYWDGTILYTCSSEAEYIGLVQNGPVSILSAHITEEKRQEYKAYQQNLNHEAEVIAAQTLLDHQITDQQTLFFIMRRY